jgi:class 3 adenylate cyclase
MTVSGPGAPAAFKLGQRLDALLLRIINRPAEETAITDEIERAFTQRRAVMVLDMSGFSRVTQAYGIVAFLVMIMKMRGLSEPIIEAHNGELVKAEGDNLFCLFPDVDDALGASMEIMAGWPSSTPSSRSTGSSTPPSASATATSWCWSTPTCSATRSTRPPSWARTSRGAARSCSPPRPGPACAWRWTCARRGGRSRS